MLTMRARAFSGLVSVSAVVMGTACSSSGNGGGSPSNGDGGSTGTAASCSDALASEAQFLGGAQQPGSWGNVPAALQKLPPGSTLCGAATRESGTATVVVSTGISIQDLNSFYQQLLTGDGCNVQAPQAIGPGTSVKFTCNGRDGAYTYSPAMGYYLLDFA